LILWWHHTWTAFGKKFGSCCQEIQGSVHNFPRFPSQEEEGGRRKETRADFFLSSNQYLDLIQPPLPTNPHHRTLTLIHHIFIKFPPVFFSPTVRDCKKRSLVFWMKAFRKGSLGNTWSADRDSCPPLSSPFFGCEQG